MTTERIHFELGQNDLMKKESFQRKTHVIDLVSAFSFDRKDQKRLMNFLKKRSDVFEKLQYVLEIKVQDLFKSFEELSVYLGLDQKRTHREA